MTTRVPCPGLPGEPCTGTMSRRSSLCKACSNKRTSRGKLAHLAIGSTPHGRALYEHAYRAGDRNGEKRGYERGYKEGYQACLDEQAKTRSEPNGGENGSSQ